jgi:2'-5' RNA ligase
LTRIFVAAPISGSTAANLASLALPFEARPVPPANLHLTLRFCGEATPGAIRRLDRALQQIRSQRIQISLKGVGSFDVAADWQAVWTAAQGDSGLLELRRLCEAAAVAASFSPDLRPWRPHITLAHVREGREETARWLAEHREFSTEPFVVSTFRLYSSVQTAAGPTYTALRAYNLTGPDRL